MKEFIVTIEYTHARVYENYTVMAESEEDAAERVEKGEGDLRSTEIDKFDQCNLEHVEAV